jgi:N-acetylneuraminate synthase
MSRCYVIAELGINHNGSLELCKQLIDAAKDCGADAIKLQKRTIEAVYTPEELARPRESPFGSTNGDLKLGLEFGREEYGRIDDYVRKIGLTWSASCWDRDSVSFIATYAPPWLKIPSALITDVELLSTYSATGIHLLMSTGMSTWDEIDAALSALGVIDEDVWDVDAARRVTLLHCHSSYPSPLEEVNLACIRSFQDRYPGVRVGYSSHTVSPWPCLMAVVYGAEVVEFHLTLDRTMFGSDQAASLEPHAAKKLIEEIRTFERCRGDGVKRVYPSEEPIKAKLRRAHV